MDSFAAAKLKRKRPEFKNAKLIDDVFERDRIYHSFAIMVRYIGKDSKVELREYLWGPDGRLDPDVLKGAEFEELEGESQFAIPEEVLEEIKARGEREEQEFLKSLEKERAEIIAHLEKVLMEKEKEEKYEDAERIKEEIERRKNSKLTNEYAEREITWKLDTLTGEHDLRCDGCGKVTNELFLTVDGIACKDCLKECKECGKPMLNAYECKVCHEPLCDEHVHFCATCHEPLCKEHATKCKFCSNELCPEHVEHCSVCNAPLCEEHTYHCSVCGAVIGPMHVRVCDVCHQDVCPEHIHKCEICGKNVCENCAVELDGKWYCKEHLEKSYGGKWVIPTTRCKTCGVALADDEINRCSVCNAPLCDEHTNHCSVCNAPLCDEHVFVSELSGKEYCEEHAGKCNICGRTVGIDELHNSVCDACVNMKEAKRKDIPREILAKFPYAKHGKKWYISRGKNIAYITEVKGITLSYRIVNGEIIEHRSKK